MTKIVVGIVAPLLCTAFMALHPKGLNGVVDDGVALFKKVGNSIVEDGRRMSALASAVKFFVTGPAALMEKTGAQATKEQNELLKLHDEKMRQRLPCTIPREGVTGLNLQTGGEKLTCE
ncbi:MAG: hypothetical protein PHD48_01165 [Alphaproteobacteria bacterium]|nr:hypothetical protein [Alphaproteobacteria bacterium]